MTLMVNVARHEGNLLLPGPSQPMMNCSLQNYRAGEARLHERFEPVLEKDTLEVVEASFVHATGYGIRYSEEGYLRITQSQGYALLTPFSRSTMHPMTPTQVTKGLFHDGDI